MIALLKRWPHDAAMVVAPDRGNRHAPARGVVVGMICRDCGAPLDADSYVLERAAVFAGDRPVQCFCIRCFPAYDAGMITHFEDHRGLPR